jgi:hypothetical protein
MGLWDYGQTEIQTQYPSQGYRCKGLLKSTPMLPATSVQNQNLYSSFNLSPDVLKFPVPMTARPEARTDFDSSKTGIAGSNPARGAWMCVRVFCVVLSCVCTGLASG